MSYGRLNFCLHPSDVVGRLWSSASTYLELSNLALGTLTAVTPSTFLLVMQN